MKVKQLKNKLLVLNQGFDIEISINWKLKKIKNVVTKDWKISITCKEPKKQSYEPIWFKIRTR